MFTQFKYWKPYVSPFDPCKPILIKDYSTPPQLYIPFQPPNLPQYPTAKQALHCGTLWPDLFSPYPNPEKKGN